MLLQGWRATAWWVLGALLLASCSRGPQPGEVLDEAKRPAATPRRSSMPPKTTSTTWTAASR